MIKKHCVWERILIMINYKYIKGKNRLLKQITISVPILFIPYSNISGSLCSVFKIYSDMGNFFFFYFKKKKKITFWSALHKHMSPWTCLRSSTLKKWTLPSWSPQTSSIPEELSKISMQVTGAGHKNWPTYQWKTHIIISSQKFMVTLW